jgi:20S proteasome subunit beta 4
LVLFRVEFLIFTHLQPGDTVQFAEYVERNIRLYQIRNLYALRPSAAASWIRRALATSLRSRKAYSVNLLVGGYDTASHDPHLYWIDYFGTMTEVPFAAHGYGAYFALSLLDRYVLLLFISSSLPPTFEYAVKIFLLTSYRYHDPEAPLEEGLATLRRCIDEVSKRLVVNPGKYKVKVVDKDGVREVEL